MDTLETINLLTTYLEQSAIELFADLGVPFQVAESLDWMPEIASVLGFAGNGMMGSLTLCTTTNCMTTLGELGHAPQPEDWLGELSNQLTGRLKRRLSPHGAVLNLSTPTVVLGERLRLSTNSGRLTLTRGLTSPIGSVSVWLEVAFRNGFSLSAQPVDNGALAEGEAVLF